MTEQRIRARTFAPAVALSIIVLAVLMTLGSVIRGSTSARAQGILPAPGANGAITAGEIPPGGGFGLIVFGGGSFAQLVAASGCLGGQVAFWTTSNGRFVPFIPSVEVQAVNAAFAAIYPGDMIPVNTPLIGRCLPVPSARVVTLEDNGVTLELRVGDAFDLRLGGNYSWRVEIGDPSVVDRQLVALIYPPPPRSEGTYEALHAGRTALTATGTPACYPGCLMPSALFAITVAVQ